LGNILQGQFRLEEAEAEFRKAITLRPDFAEAHCNLGHTLRYLGRFTDTLAALGQGHKLGSGRPGWPYPSAAWVHHAEQLVELDAKLPRILKGEVRSTGAPEQIALAEVCKCKKYYATSARFYADAFAADPKLADDLKSGNRYNAACYAALAAAGQGKDPTLPDDKEKARLRSQALEWLQANLALWTKQAQSGQPQERVPVLSTLRHWQQDADLASVRDANALAKLAPAEREAWRKLWAAVDDLLTKTTTPAPPAKKP
jgi:tetratricopeptide (TPR) repeat protein